MNSGTVIRNISVVVSSSLVLILAACGGGGGGGGGSGVVTPTFNLTCNLTSTYTSSLGGPITTAGTGTPTTTVIALHGKNGSAASSTVATLAAGLNAAGYDVIRPNMPWANFNWDGSLCDAMAYLDDLIDTEITAGKSVILLGHSLASPVVLSYAALSNTTKPDALVIVAPGHFVGVSMNFDNLHAADVTKAKNSVIAGNGDVVDTFQTSNTGGMQNISTTPNIYLSYHSPDQFPDIRSSIPLVNEPTLWLAGDADTGTNSAIVLGIIDVVNKNSNIDYRVIAGDHYSVVDNVTGELDPWYRTL